MKRNGFPKLGLRIMKISDFQLLKLGYSPKQLNKLNQKKGGISLCQTK
ncbi:MAG: hypothetical protein Q8875_01650 [Pigeon pea little leaf phytoplasma]|uniref:Uncharacterized protein n=1 Tax=Candidatus Phytoplasma fabacearum TaxID=2982628 RepID=A0ABU8ZSQ6_9MOLU|nr:hypothetical protein [Candidatus Phytoplasma stylosanthis]MDV3168226.1 hypothetical protein [Candidatus Phytoplasma stylosanthis]MDV3173814.1 hypothetical protein [Candidatus Phytoplasma stylosanthis]MDV3196224.1 hypothetical protein [Candidatus Phytoplasma stylosanthis]MDV3200336.1 hypothetical protein [Pigeon pea little leaf phytoplasma]